MRKKEYYFLLVCLVLFILCLPILAQAQGPKKEFIVAQFTFEPGQELKDLTGNFPDLTLVGATVEKGQLKTASGKWAVSSPMKKGPDISEKTMVSWCYIDDLNVLAGSVLTIDQIGADQFDAMVFGERQPQKWMAGSSNFTRTQDAAPGFQETKTGILIYLAYSYQKDGATNHVRLYHDGELFGDYSLGTVPTWKPGDAEIFFGIRHGNAGGGGPGNLACRIEEARIYNTVLSQADIKELQKGAFAVGPSGKLATLWGDVKVK